MQRISILLLLQVVCLSTSLQAQAPASQPKLAPKDATWVDPSPHKSGFVTANGIRINYLDWGGSGPALILIHGIGDNPHIFDDMAPAFTDRFRVIAYARRGHGQSEAKEPYDNATLTEDLRGLMDALNIKKAHLTGWSMGGGEITAMAGAHPERVDRLVYLDSYDWDDPGFVTAFKAMPAITLNPSASSMTSLDAWRAYQSTVFFAGLRDMQPVEAFIRELVIVQPDGTVRPRMSDAAGEALGSTLLTYHKDYTKVHSPALAIYAETFTGRDTCNLDPALCADLLAWGKKYDVASFRTASIERARRELSNVEIVNVTGTHNNFVFTSRQQVVAAMRRFLGESPKGEAWSDPSPHKSGFVTANGVRLNYLDWGGSGPALILIHGIGDNPHKFDDVAPAFTHQFRVIAYARRGHGDSEAREPYDVATLTEDLRGLMDALNIKRAHLAGWSMGGNEITAMAGLHPERVDRLVYLDGGYDWADSAEVFKAMPPVFEPPAKAMTSLDEFRRFTHAAFLPGVTDPSPFEPYIRDLVVVQPDGSVTNKMSDATWQALVNSASTSRRDYSKVHLPALAIYAETFADTRHGDPALRAQVLVWEQKYMGPFRTASIERVRRELSNVEIINVPGTHNDFVFTSREQVVAARRRFLSESKVSALQSPLVGPLVELSQPNTVAKCNTGSNVFGSWPTGHAGEPSVVVNPVHPNNIVAAWIQGPGHAIVAATSPDGGKSWKRVPIPLTTCSSGPYLLGGDNWLSFSSKGDLYLGAAATNNKDLSELRVVVVKSSDGGLHWSAPQTVPGSDSVDAPEHHPSLTSDPADARFVYLVWEEYPGWPTPKNSGGAFARSTDGGVTWEARRAIVQTDENRWVQFSQIFALPNGTLVDLYEFHESPPDKPSTSRLQLLRSKDHGATWSAPSDAVTITPLRAANGWSNLAVPKRGKAVRDIPNPSFAVDRRNGHLYAVWEDGRFSNSQYNDIAFSMSVDGGSTWSVPVRVNKTPLDIPTVDRQAFLPAIAVAPNGTIAVSYYDFRFNNANAGLSTDYWLVQCSPSSDVTPSDVACWNSEVRLTDKSFDMEAVVPIVADGIFLGDYFGLVGAGDAFVAVFTQPDDHKITSIFARRVGP